MLAFAAAATAAEVRIDAESLGRLPAGSKAHPSIKAAPEAEGGALLFSDGGITLPTAHLVTAGAGAIELWCQAPKDWPASGDRALFHAATSGHVHVTLFFRDGALSAVYKGGEEHFSAIRCPASGSWKAGTWHRVQFGWQADGDEVEFILLVDGAMAGVATGQLIDKWPATCEVGVRANGTPWRGLLREIVLSRRRIPIPGLEPGERTITIHGDREAGDCHKFWTVANCNKPQEFLDPKYAREIPRRQPYVKQINAVYLLGGRYPDKNCWYRGIGPDGDVRADFAGMIAQLKSMEAGGFVPWPVLDNVPYHMSDPPQESTYGNTAPPKDERIWNKYVEAAVGAMVGAFGREKVGRWWFRAGTEPDLCPGHWAGTREQYFAHYDHTVDAVSRVVPEAKIGPGNILNPAGGEFGTATRKQWGLDIIDHAALGTNHVTGAKGSRMDWFSFSWYGRVGEPLSVFDEAVGAIRSRLGRYPQFAGLPLIVGEFAVLHDESGKRLWGGDTTEWAASFYAALADRVYRHGIRQVYEWSETTSGVPHPRTQVIAMLENMSGGRRLSTEVKAASRADCGAVGCRKGEDLFALVYNHRPLRRPKVVERVHLILRDPRMRAGEAWKLSEWRVDAEHASWAHVFAADCGAAGIQRLPTAGRHEGAVGYEYGKPGEGLFRQNILKYKALSQMPATRFAESVTVADGQLALDFDMPGHSVRLLRLSPAP